MAKLTAKQRKKLPAKAFGLPKTRQFPLNNQNHDQAAIRDSARALNAGTITASQQAQIDQKARAQLKRR